MQKHISRHVSIIAREARMVFTRTHHGTIYSRILARNCADGYAKSALVYKKLNQPGPPVHLALDWVGNVTHRAALASLFCGDWPLGFEALGSEPIGSEPLRSGPLLL